MATIVIEIAITHKYMMYIIYFRPSQKKRRPGRPRKVQQTKPHPGRPSKTAGSKKQKQNQQRARKISKGAIVKAATDKAAVEAAAAVVQHESVLLDRRKLSAADRVGDSDLPIVEVSVTVGTKAGIDVPRALSVHLDDFLQHRCIKGVAAYEHGGIGGHGHWQCVFQCRASSAKAVKLHLDHVLRPRFSDMDLCVRLLTGRRLHTFVGMVGYCFKDEGVSPDWVVIEKGIEQRDKDLGREEYLKYGVSRSSRDKVSLNPRNLLERMQVYAERHAFRHCGPLQLITDMIHTGTYTLGAEWVVPRIGSGMDEQRFETLWYINQHPTQATTDMVREIVCAPNAHDAAERIRYFEADQEGEQDEEEAEQRRAATREQLDVYADNTVVDVLHRVMAAAKSAGIHSVWPEGYWPIYEADALHEIARLRSLIEAHLEHK